MSNDISHIYHADPHDMATYSVDGSITYDRLNPREFVRKAVKITGNKQVGLATAGSRVHGAIHVVESTDGDSIKVTVQTGGYTVFENSEGAPAVTPGSAVVGGATAGDIRNAVASTDALANDGNVARGQVTSLEGDVIVVKL